MDYKYLFISLSFIENWLKNLQLSITNMDPLKIANYSESREEFYYFLEKIDFELEKFDPCNDDIKEYARFLYLKVMISDVYFYLERIIKSISELFKNKEKSFSLIYDIIILTRKNFISIVESLSDSNNNDKYYIEEKLVATLKTIDKQFGFLFTENGKNLFYIHPILGKFRSMNLCMLNYLRR